MNLLSQQLWKYILTDILTECKHLPAALAAGLLAGCLLLFFSRKKEKALVRILFIVYTIMLFIITILEREPGSRTRTSLTLFETLGSPRANAYVIENILLFIPFGFLGPKLWKCLRRLPACILAGFCLSLTVEIIQLVTGRGYFQVDDILTNSIGTGIGAVGGMVRFRRPDCRGQRM